MTQQSKLRTAAGRLRQQIKDTTTICSPREIISGGAPNLGKVLAVMMANQIAVMMAVVDLCETLDGPEFTAPEGDEG